MRTVFHTALVFFCIFTMTAEALSQDKALVGQSCVVIEDYPPDVSLKQQWEWVLKSHNVRVEMGEMTALDTSEILTVGSGDREGRPAHNRESNTFAVVPNTGLHGEYEQEILEVTINVTSESAMHTATWKSHVVGTERYVEQEQPVELRNQQTHTITFGERVGFLTPDPLTVTITPKTTDIAVQYDSEEDVVREILRKEMLRGGSEETLENLQSSYAVGKKYIRAEGQGEVEHKREEWIEKQGKYRIQLTDPLGLRTFIIVNGDQGWYQNPPAGIYNARKMRPDQVAQFQQNAGYSVHFSNPYAENVDIHYNGKKEISNVLCHYLVFDRKGGWEVHRYYSVERDVKIKEEVFNPSGEMVAWTVWSDYREVGGLLWHHQINGKMSNGDNYGTIIDSYTLNEDIPDYLFTVGGQAYPGLDR